MIPKYPDITVTLTGRDGNAFAILGRCRAAARAAGQAEIIAQAAAERAALLLELEAQDRDSPTADDPALGADAVRRLLAR